jgi:beta-glucosidase
MSFPDGFLWGAGASSYQIEGAAYEDGKGESVWDMMCRKPGVIYSGHTGDVACDHYHRYREDVGLMADMGLKAYRFSVSWPRVMPQGTGAINEKGLGFYDRLVDELLAHNIEPLVTLFHWDYPYALYLRGHWLNSDSPRWFADYAETVVRRLGDRVRWWLTLNEPQCFIGLGLLEAFQAPGDRLGFREVLIAAHNTLLAHGLGVQAIRAASPQECRVGFAPVGSGKVPASDSPEDIEAARDWMFRVVKRDMWQKTWWMDPVFHGHYPEDGLALFGADVPDFPSSDMDIISQPLDFFAVNHYSAQFVRRGENGEPEDLTIPPGAPMFTTRTHVVPEVLYWAPRFYYDRYRLPYMVTENGLSTVDWVSLDGRVHDTQRIDQMRRYLLQFRRAAEDGVPLLGYFHWSIMDNFEFTEGYRERYGLIHVDYQTLKRTPKESSKWYRKVIESNGACLDEDPDIGVREE